MIRKIEVPQHVLDWISKPENVLSLRFGDNLDELLTLSRELEEIFDKQDMPIHRFGKYQGEWCLSRIKGNCFYWAGQDFVSHREAMRIKASWEITKNTNPQLAARDLEALQRYGDGKLVLRFYAQPPKNKTREIESGFPIDYRLSPRVALIPGMGIYICQCSEKRSFLHPSRNEVENLFLRA